MTTLALMDGGSFMKRLAGDGVGNFESYQVEEEVMIHSQGAMAMG